MLPQIRAPGACVRRPGGLRWSPMRYMVLGLVFHVSLTILLDLGLFSIVMLSLYPCLLRPAEARRVLEFFASYYPGKEVPHSVVA